MNGAQPNGNRGTSRKKAQNAQKQSFLFLRLLRLFAAIKIVGSGSVRRFSNIVCPNQPQTILQEGAEGAEKIHEEILLLWRPLLPPVKIPDRGNPNARS